MGEGKISLFFFLSRFEVLHQGQKVRKDWQLSSKVIKSEKMMMASYFLIFPHLLECFHFWKSTFLLWKKPLLPSLILLVVGTKSTANFVHQCEDQGSSGSGGCPSWYAWDCYLFMLDSEAAPHNVPFHSQKSPGMVKKFIIILDINSFVSFYLFRFLHVPASSKTRRCYWRTKSFLSTQMSPPTITAIISFHFCLFFI